MNDQRPPRNFWEAAFSPGRDYIVVFLLVLLVTALVGNLAYEILTDSEMLTAQDVVLTLGAVILLSLIAGFVWENRKKMYIPFSVTERNKLQRSQAVIAVPSNVGNIGKIVRYHSGILKHLWLVGDQSVDRNAQDCQLNYESEIEGADSIHRIRTGEKEEAKNIYEGFHTAIQEALNLGIPREQIVVDVTGGTKPMTISAFIAALEFGLKVSYVQSNYEQINGSEEIKRAGEEFTVVEFNVSEFPVEVKYISQDDNAE